MDYYYPINAITYFFKNNCTSASNNGHGKNYVRSQEKINNK